MDSFIFLINIQLSIKLLKLINLEADLIKAALTATELLK